MKHDLITWGIIIVIVICQVKIAKEALIKINRFQKIIPDSKKLTTVKTYIREDQIESINHTAIFKDFKKFEKDESIINTEFNEV